MSEGSVFGSLKHLLVGKPIPSHLAHHERLSKVTGLAVLSSDPLSSVAYATEETVRTLMLAGAGALALSIPIGVIIAFLLLVVAFSYRQTIYAYPGGGGAYIVAKDNLGVGAGLVAGSALLVDYVMTVAVSIAAGVAALVSAFPGLQPDRVSLSLGFIAIIAVGNLRGLRESGRIFAAPTYFFVVTILALIGMGVWHGLTGTIHPFAPPASTSPPETLTLFLLLTAFSNGCTAMTGVEAVSNGVPAFRLSFHGPQNLTDRCTLYCLLVWPEPGHRQIPSASADAGGHDQFRFGHGADDADQCRPAHTGGSRTDRCDQRFARGHRNQRAGRISGGNQ